MIGSYSMATMGSVQLFRLVEAAKLVGLSPTTLKRYIREQRLVPQPRKSDQETIFLTRQALLDAGLDIMNDPGPHGAHDSGRDTAAVSRARAEMETLRQRNDELIAENATLRERAARAEGALEIAERILEQYNQRTRMNDRPVEELRP